MDELKTVFVATLPLFINQSPEFKRRGALLIFEEGYRWVEDQLSNRLHIIYAHESLQSPAEVSYKKDTYYTGELIPLQVIRLGRRGRWGPLAPLVSSASLSPFISSKTP